MAVLTIASVIFAVYQTFYYERRGVLSITVTPPAKVLDIRRAVGGLDVSYAGVNLRDTKKTLWIVNSTVRNDGNAEIRKGDFDENDLLGFLVENGKVVDTPSLRTSIPYLQKHLVLSQLDDRVTLSSSIIEPGDTIFVSFLVLGDEEVAPNILPLGKIAGVRAIDFRSAGDAQKSSISEVLIKSDNWWTHPLRMLFYILALVIIIALIGGLVASVMVPFEKIKKAKAKSKRQAAIDGYKSGESISKEVRILGRMYVEKGSDVLLQANQLFGALCDRLSRRSSYHQIYTNNIPSYMESSVELPFYMRHFMLRMNKLGFPVSESASKEQLDVWVSELDDLADYLSLDVKSSGFDAWARSYHEYLDVKI